MQSWNKQINRLQEYHYQLNVVSLTHSSILNFIWQKQDTEITVSFQIWNDNPYLMYIYSVYPIWNKQPPSCVVIFVRISSWKCSIRNCDGMSWKFRFLFLELFPLYWSRSGALQTTCFSLTRHLYQGTDVRNNSSD